MSIFADSAKEAMGWARQAFERVVKIEQRMESVADAVHKFETRTMLQQQGFEQRLEQRMVALEASVKSDLRDFETRLRLLEQQMASVSAKVDGGFAQAAALLYADKLARRDSGISATVRDETPRLSDTTTES